MTCEDGASFVARPVQVHGEQMNHVEAIFLTVGLPLHQQHLLREPIRSIRLLGIAVPEMLLPERDRSRLGIRADRAHADVFLDARAACVLQGHRAHHQIFVGESSRIGAIRADAAHDGGQVDHDTRLERGEEPLDIRFTREVVVATAGNHDVRPAPAAQVRDQPSGPGSPPRRSPLSSCRSSWPIASLAHHLRRGSPIRLRGATAATTHRSTVTSPLNPESQIRARGRNAN